MTRRRKQKTKRQQAKKHAAVKHTKSPKEELISRLTRARMLRARSATPHSLEKVLKILRGILKNPKDDEDWNDAGMFLATLLLQQQQDNEENGESIAQELLHERGFVYRLSRQALRQSHETSVRSSSAVVPYASAWDDMLPQAWFQHFWQAFSPTSSFWTNYSDGSSGGRPPSPYFSYVVPLVENGDNEDTVLYRAICLIQQQVATVYPQVLDCEAAEWWCHCRPHASGHQLHFDSDDEGRGGVRNPVASCVLSLTDGTVGGETLLTTQTATDTQLAQNTGWLCRGKRNRLLTFRGNLLHGVVPGGGADATHKEGRRVTWMVAFWKSIRIQDEPGHGSARPCWKRVRDEPWAQPLLLTSDDNLQSNPGPAKDCFYQVPVWEDVDQELNQEKGESLAQVREKRTLPPYDAFFQFYT